jgi:glycerol-3-phosphate acyltransferase PlsY
VPIDQRQAFFWIGPQDIIALIGFPLIAFAIGSIPFGLIVGRLFYGADIRKSGSGNIGAANALRSYGKAGGAAVLLLDALKGLAPALLFMFFAFPAAAAALGAIAVLGHCFSPWLGFKGGKGVATWLGALFGLSWIAGVAFIAIWLAAFLPTRYASLGSLVASVLAPVVLWLLFHSTFVSVVATLVALLILWKHRENIARLLAGTENKINLGRAQA